MTFMNRFVMSVAVLAGAGLLVAGGEAEAGTASANLTVSATVSATCLLTTTPLAFGAYDPIVANATTDKTGTGIVTVTCTSGASSTVTLGQGSSPKTGSTNEVPLRRMTDGAGTPDYLSYLLYQDAPHATVWGNTVSTGKAHTGTGAAAPLTVYGVVTVGQNVPAGSYSDTVVATVTF